MPCVSGKHLLGGMNASRQSVCGNIHRRLWFLSVHYASRTNNTKHVHHFFFLFLTITRYAEYS